MPLLSAIISFPELQCGFRNGYGRDRRYALEFYKWNKWFRRLDAKRHTAELGTLSFARDPQYQRQQPVTFHAK
jgi:hypothetical protein